MNLSIRNRSAARPRTRRALTRLLTAGALVAFGAVAWSGSAFASHAPPETKLWGYEAAAADARILQYDIGTDTFDTSCVPLPGASNGRGIAFDPRLAPAGGLWITRVAPGTFAGDGLIHKVGLPPSCPNLGSIPFGDGPGGQVPDDIGALDLDPDTGNLYAAEYISGLLGKDPVSTLYEVEENTGAIIRACNLPTADQNGNDTLAVVKDHPGLPPGKYLVTDNGEFSTTAQFVIPVTSMGPYTPPAGAPDCQIVATGNTPGGRTGIDFEPVSNDMIATDLGQIFDQNGFPWGTTQASMSAAPSSQIEDITLQVPPGAPANLTLTPATDTNEVGTQHCVTATVTDVLGIPVPGVTVRFSVTGANPTSGTGTSPTDANGQATFCYVGTVAGVDTISAYADTNSNAVQDPGEPGATATKTWTPGPPATLDLQPETDVNVVDSQHCVTATVKDAFGNPTPNIVVRFTIVGSVNTSGSRVTNAAGEATFCYIGPALPGMDVITAFADTNNNGVQDANEPSDRATKEWVVPPSVEGCKVTYGGRITAANDDKATFGGNAQAPFKGQEQYQDHGPAVDINVHSIEITSVTCSADGTQASIFGQATINGEGTFDFRIDLKDLGEPGTSDTYRIRLSNGYDSGEQVLEGGNVQIHFP